MLTEHQLHAIFLAPTLSYGAKVTAYWLSKRDCSVVELAPLLNVKPRQVYRFLDQLKTAFPSSYIPRFSEDQSLVSKSDNNEANGESEPNYATLSENDTDCARQVHPKLSSKCPVPKKSQKSHKPQNSLVVVPELSQLPTTYYATKEIRQEDSEGILLDNLHHTRSSEEVVISGNNTELIDHNRLLLNNINNNSYRAISLLQSTRAQKNGEFDSKEPIKQLERDKSFSRKFPVKRSANSDISNTRDISTTIQRVCDNSSSERMDPNLRDSNIGQEAQIQELNWRDLENNGISGSTIALYREMLAARTKHSGSGEVWEGILRSSKQSRAHVDVNGIGLFELELEKDNPSRVCEPTIEERDLAILETIDRVYTQEEAHGLHGRFVPRRPHDARLRTSAHMAPPIDLDGPELADYLQRSLGAFGWVVPVPNSNSESSNDRSEHSESDRFVDTQKSCSSTIHSSALVSTKTSSSSKREEVLRSIAKIRARMGNVSAGNNNKRTTDAASTRS